jgi:integrase
VSGSRRRRVTGNWILGAANGTLRTFYWLAAETGMRAGELCGLRLEDLDLDHGVVNVKQSVWRGQVQTPKTASSIRQFPISEQLFAHLRSFLGLWRPNPLHLVFATRNGTPWDQNLVVKRKLHPLLDALGIRRCGLHAFRHTNGSLMDMLHAPLRVRQERLGHAPGSDITLAVYTHAFGEKTIGTSPNNWAKFCAQMCPTGRKKKPSSMAKV